MNFKRGKYRFKVADDCDAAFRNALRLLAEFGFGDALVNDRLGEIKARVQLGYCPDGATEIKGAPGFYAITIFTVLFVFKVNQEIMLISIEAVDAASLTRVLEERAARRIATE